MSTVVTVDSVFDGKAFAKTLPTSPGVYRMLGAQRQVLYVGKAANLSKRVASYFLRPKLELRLMLMIAKTVQIEITITRTESEALLLENELIKSLKPRYNILLKDDKSYPQVFVSVGEPFPKIVFHRGPKHSKGRYFGPFPSALAVRESINTLQRIFRIRSCEDSYFKTRSRPCLQHQIGRCTAPCVGLIHEMDYAHDVRHATMFLEGRSSAIVDEMIHDMDKASHALAFERAAVIRDRIANLKKIQARQFVSHVEKDADVLACSVGYGMACVHAMFFRHGSSVGGRNFFPNVPDSVTSQSVLEAFVSQYYLEHPPPSVILVSESLGDLSCLSAALSERQSGSIQIRHVQRGEKLKLIEHAKRNAEQALIAESEKQENLCKRWDALSQVLSCDREIRRIECFDISHMQGEATVASCVVFDPKGAVKAQYRRYSVNGITPGDDYAAMRQALDRRFKRALKDQSAIPDLLLIDGGRGQLTQAHEVLSELDIGGITVVGIAKGEGRKPGLEALFVGDDFQTIKLKATDPALHLIQQIRDEAHRFALMGHRQQRHKKRQKSVLEEIPGVGARRRTALLKQFGGMTGVIGAGVEELMQVSGIHFELAQRIYAALHD